MCLVGLGLCFKSESIMYEKGFIKCSAQYCKNFQALKKNTQSEILLWT